MLNPAKNIPSFLSFLVELVIYAGFVTGYFLLVLNFLGHWIDQVSKSNKVSYAFLALGLMVVQGVVLGRLTTAVMWVIQFFQAIISALFVIARPHETVTSPKDAPGLLIYRFGGPLLAINADYFARHVQELIADSYPPVTLFLINAEAIIDMDGTGIETLDELHQTLKKKNIELGLCVVKGNFRKALSSTSLPRRAGFNVYPSEAAVIEKMTKKPSKPKKSPVPLRSRHTNSEFSIPNSSSPQGGNEADANRAPEFSWRAREAPFDGKSCSDEMRTNPWKHCSNP